MSEFAAGAATALIGAVIGGLFTALAAWMQLRGTFRQQMVVLSRQQRQQAAIEAVRALRAGQNYLDTRDYCYADEPLDTCTTASRYKELATARQFFDDGYDSWGEWLPPKVRNAYLMFLDTCGFNLRGYSEMIDSLDGSAPGCARCRYGSEVGHGAYNVSQDILTSVAVVPLPRTSPLRRVWPLRSRTTS